MKWIPWERTTDGKIAQLKESRGTYFIPALALLSLADAKMTQPGLISAHFQRDLILFEQRVSVFLHTTQKSEYLGVYLPDTDEEELNHSKDSSRLLPTVCIRHAYWEQQQDTNRFRTSSDMKTYVSEDQQITSRIQFLSENMASALVPLINEIQTMVRQGIRLQQVTNSTSREQSITISVIDEEMTFSLMYPSSQRENQVLEGWIEQWRLSFAGLEQEAGLIPDEGCFISYPHSLWEQIARFPEESFADYYQKVSTRQQKRT